MTRTTRSTRSARSARRALGTTAAAVGAAAALAVPLAAPAGAAVPAPTVVASGLVGPLGLAVSEPGDVYVAQSFAGLVTQVGAPAPVAVVEGGSPNGVEVLSDGSVAYTYTAGTPEAPEAKLVKVRANGTRQVLGDLARHEIRNNPDGKVTYGFKGITADCRAQVPDFIGGAPQKGDVNPNPYKVAELGKGRYVVADAGANALLRVGPDRKVSTLAVLPPVGVRITGAIAEGLGLPDCTVGSRYDLHPVPTDVEVGPDGMLYVTSLPGGPEDGSLGALGGVFRVDPATGSVKRVVTGLVSAVDLAVDHDGTMYVAELFAGKITKIAKGKKSTLAEVPLPGAVELHHEHLYATTEVLPAPEAAPDGKVLRWTLR
ncbi:ScyD/ScyE family protein [Vallicoccus soli]|uniref:ScyD/ScyE family protein n=1 Tax=Vallicoccus soli TaxID=2339232 RepID=A0A3A3YVB4_9ACTN|nr:ScyD/ScyE family protein [Vallicoccus soli]RJK94164.1 ScyD/ScyE family protein [Vallicoccus soli]